MIEERKKPEPKSRKDFVNMEIHVKKYNEPHQLMVDVHDGTIMARTKYEMPTVTKVMGQPRLVDIP